MAWRMKTLECKRYVIYYADLNPAMGSEIKKIRSVVIVSQDEMNKYLDTVVVCPLTSKVHPQWRSRIQIKCAQKNAEIAVDQIRTISKQRLKSKIDQLSTGKAAQLRKLITDMYGE
jgi:mRNA interferase MazF